MPLFNNKAPSESMHCLGFQIDLLPESHDQERIAVRTG